MAPRTLVIALGASVVAAACTESTGPPLDDQLPPQQEQFEQLTAPDGALRGLRWALEDGAPEFEIVAGEEDEGAGELGLGVVAAPQSGPPRLDRYEVSFWAVRGKRRSIQINYVTDDGFRPFLRFTVPRWALHRRADGTRIRRGEAVLVTVTVNRTQLRADFEPSGLQFSRWSPVVLKIWYGGADWDFNGDGVVDEQDERNKRRLNLWFQDEPGADWYTVPSYHSRRGQWIIAWMSHFTGGQVGY